MAVYNQCHSINLILSFPITFVRDIILKADEPFKLEILDSIRSEPITIYSMVGRNATSEEPAWWDLCAGPHLESTGQVDAKAVELLTIAGAYWRGDEKQPMLQVTVIPIIFTGN